MIWYNIKFKINKFKSCWTLYRKKQIIVKNSIKIRKKVVKQFFVLKIKKNPIVKEGEKKTIFYCVCRRIKTQGYERERKWD